MHELYLRRENDHWSFNLLPRLDICLNPVSGTTRTVFRQHKRKEDGIFVRHYLTYVMIYRLDGEVIIQIGDKKYSPIDDLECDISPAGPFYRFSLKQRGRLIYKTLYWNPQIALLAIVDPDFGVFGDQDVFKCIWDTIQAGETHRIVDA